MLRAQRSRKANVPLPAGEGAAEDASCRNALLVVGTYHSVMAGLVFRRNKFTMLFSIKHHVGCIKSVAVGDRYMASSGTDERVFLFTNKGQQRVTAGEQAKLRAAGACMSLRLADLGYVSPPGEVCCLLFTPNSQHMLCGCADGQLVMYRTRDWSVSLALPLHEKSISAIALHPRSEGTLAITVGADRYVVAMDLAKGRLLSKWRYNTSLAATDGEKGNGEEDVQRTKRAKLERRDDPRDVRFSSNGRYFTVLSSHAFAVYETATTQLVARYCAASPQPHEELHVFSFIDDETMIFGNESGVLLGCRGPWTEKDVRLHQIVTHTPLGDAPAVDDEKKQPVSHPMSHATRLKAIQCVGRMVFSLDAAGAVIAWRMGDVADGATITLSYVCSANCQGRATTMDAMPL